MRPAATGDVAELGDWSAQPVTTVETLEPGPVAALGALFDGDSPTPAVGEPLPPLWHWVALPRWSPSSLLGEDGHPRRGTFLPSLDDLPRRMFAGGEVTFHGDLVVGGQVRRTSLVTSVEQKEGRSGPLAVVQVTSQLEDPSGALLLVERQDLVYRPAPVLPDRFPEPPSVLASVGPPLVRAGAVWRFRTDPTLLMRFSAATANAHRIHYDWVYATRAEGYPGLVVHGPLSTLILAETLRQSAPGRTVTRLRHRNLAPLFCGDEATVSVAVAAQQDPPESVEIALHGVDGTPLAGMSATLAPSPKGTI